MDTAELVRDNDSGFFDEAPIGYMVIDQEFNIVDLNGATAKYIGSGSGELYGKHVCSVVSPLDHDILYRHLQHVLRRSVVLSAKIRLLKSDGDVLYTQWWSKPVKFFHAEQELILIALADVTAETLYKPLLKRKNAFQRTLIENSPFAIFSTNGDGVINMINPAAEKMFGYRARDLIGSATPLIFMLKQELEARAGCELNGVVYDDPVKLISAYASSVNIRASEWTYVRKDGVRGVMLLSIAVVNDSVGKRNGVIFEAIDISHQKKQETTIMELNRLLKSRVRELHQAKQRSDATLMAIADGVIITDDQGRVEVLNHAAESFFGVNEAYVKGRRLNEILEVQSADGRQIGECIDECLTTQESVCTKSSRVVIGKDGKRRHIEENIAPVRNSYGKVDGAVLVLRDVTHSVRLVKRVIYQAHHDELTGLYNRRYFNQLMKSYFDEIKNQDVSKASECALLILDLDHFKAINDSCGHLAGDELLRALAKVFKETSGENATVARVGGDEFAIFIRNTDAQHAYIKGVSIIKAVKGLRFVWEGKASNIGVSIGVAMTDGRDIDPLQLQAQADSAAYMAKRSGRNCVHVYDKSLGNYNYNGNVDWFDRINRAVDEDRFVLYAQSIKSLGKTSNYNFEFLVRLNDQEKAIVMPAEFIPIAERYNLMSSIDRWVASNVFRWLSENRHLFDDMDRCSVNISATSLNEDGFCLFIEDELLRWEVPCSKVCFELTETARIANIPATAASMERLKRYGCEFSLDDFGSGYTSYELLKALPVDYIKIDGQLVRDSVGSEVDYVMVKSICDIGRAMGKKTIAEYVENETVLKSMQEIGVDYVQGFYIDHPKNITEYVFG